MKLLDFIQLHLFIYLLIAICFFMHHFTNVPLCCLLITYLISHIYTAFTMIIYCFLIIAFFTKNNDISGFFACWL